MTSPQNQVLGTETIKSIEKVLKEHNVQKYSMKISEGSEKGQNFTSIVVQVDIDGCDNQNNKVHKSFIIKTGPFDEEIRKQVKIQDFFIREIYIYTKLFREYELLQKEKCITNIFKSYPECYACTLQTSEESIVLQNLKLSGYKHWNRKTPIDANHAFLIMKEYGRLHALSYAIRDQKFSVFEDIIDNTKPTWSEYLSKGDTREFCENCVNQALKSLDPVKDVMVYNKFKNFATNVHEIISKCVNVSGSDQYSVFAHVDSSLSNQMFQYEDIDNPNKPTSISLFDWQMSSMSSPTIDLSIIILSSTDKNLRHEHYNDMIKQYYISLCSMMKELGTNAEQMLPFTVLEQHLKKYSIAGLYISTMLILIQYMNYEDIPNTMEDRTLNFKLHDVEQYNIRMRDVILDFDKYVMAPFQEQILSSEATKAFDDILKAQGVTNYCIKIRALGSEQGQNSAALVYQVDVNGHDNTGNNVHKSFIIKSAPLNNEIRNVSHIRDAFIREIYVYSQVLCEFDSMQEEKCIINPFKSYPEYYKSTSQPFEEFIILQNLKLCGYKHYNCDMPVDLDHAVMVMRNYGRLHALSYALRDQKLHIFEQIIKNTHDDCFQNFQKHDVRAFCKDRIEQALKSLDPIKEKPAYQKFQEFSENMFEILPKCVDSKLTDKHAVIIHGDCSLSNFMFKYEDFENAHKPTAMRFLDWQLTRLGSPAVDLTTFLFSSTDKKLRDLHYDDLINEYYNSLCSMLEQLGTDPMKMLPFSILQQHLKKYGIFGLFMAALLVFVKSNKKFSIRDILHDTKQLCFKLIHSEGARHFTTTVHVSRVKVYRNHKDSEESFEETDGISEELDLERDASEQPEAAGAIYVEELIPREHKRMKKVPKYLSDFELD
ncbi:hypothetical protein RN001_000485 [Aquatica leii]|uniref:CHK kinase-like domain-containing protein n=1 Tax=Aquatica leii TaxID=1421715 RepID=A0AAN7PEZ5_9COLE|nr:hypothetical protein RN001_000485 [Aquatica leii]